MLKISSIIFACLLLSSCGLWHTHQVVATSKQVPISAQAHFYQGLIAEDQENWKQAVEHFDKASNIDPKASRIHSHLGKCLIALNRYRKGVEALKHAEKLADSNDYLIWYDIGLSYQTARIYLAAKICYQKSVAIEPKFQKAHKALAALSNF